MWIVYLLILLGAVALAVLAFRFSPAGRRAAAQDRAMTAAYTPDPNNRKTVSAAGWTRPEIDRIVADFLRAYQLPDTTIRVTAQSDTAFVLAFPQDITPVHLYFLVNYVSYPKDFDLTGRTILVFADVVLSPAFGIPDPALAGRHAMLYMPANDDEGDLVYAKVESGSAYEISFTNLIWKAVADPRLPAGLR